MDLLVCTTFSLGFGCIAPLKGHQSSHLTPLGVYTWPPEDDGALRGTYQLKGYTMRVGSRSGARARSPVGQVNLALHGVGRLFGPLWHQHMLEHCLFSMRNKGQARFPVVKRCVLLTMSGGNNATSGSKE